MTALSVGLSVWLRTHPQVVAWTKATAQRVVRSFAASLLSVLTVGNAVTTVDWGQALTVAAGAAVVTLLLCVAGGATSGGGPAFGHTEVAKAQG